MSPRKRAFKNGFRQRDCRACGAPNHFKSGVNSLPCVSVELFGALVSYAKENGRTWRAKLRALWESGKDEGPLRGLRNVIGPGKRLDKCHPEKVVVNEAVRALLKKNLQEGTT